MTLFPVQAELVEAVTTIRGAEVMAFWVYILRCADSSYYTGHTDNLEKRLAEHTGGAMPTCYTYKRRPVELVFSQEFATREEALTSERQI